MQRSAIQCPYDGCNHLNAGSARYCARCGRPLVVLTESNSPAGCGSGWAAMNLFSLVTLIGLPIFLFATGLAQRYPPLLLLCGFGLFGFGLGRRGGGRRHEP